MTQNEARWVVIHQLACHWFMPWHYWKQ